MNIWFATNNLHKKEELEAILGLNLKKPSDEGLEFNPDETGSTFMDNALLKARELKKILHNKNDYVIADDSGLCVDALDGRPGIFSARYGETGSLQLTSESKNLLLLGEMENKIDRKARFICTMALLFEHEKFIVVQETLEGEIVKNKECIKGTGGFGYDPVFYIPELGRTLAELSPEEKNAISHRGKAGKILKRFFNSLV